MLRASALSRLVGLRTAAAILLVLPVSAISAQAQESADRAAILQQSLALSDAYVRGDIEALVAIYTSDGVAVPGAADFVRGRESLLDLWQLGPGRTVLRHSATPTELVIDGDHAYDWGYYEGQAAQNGEPRPPFRGAYVIVWRRGDDGVWRIAVDMWNRL